MTDHSQLVKTLEWKANSLSSKYPSYHSFKSALRLHYSIKTGEARSMGAFALFLDLGSGSGWVSAHVSLDAAKATAQADYTARILSALNLDAIDALQARVAELEAGLQPFAKAAQPIFARNYDDLDTVMTMKATSAKGSRVELVLQFRPFRTARALLERKA